MRTEIDSWYVSQHIERGQLSQKIKMDFLLFSEWLFFQLNFGAKIFGHCILEIWQFHWGRHNRLLKSWYQEKGSQKLEICTKYWYLSNSDVHFFTLKYCFCTKPFKYVKDLSICEISKSTLGHIFLDILTLHPHNSKFSLLTTGTFPYVEWQSHVGC